MPDRPSDIAADSMLLLELALTIGQTLDFELERRCEAFLRILMSRKNLSFGAVWVRHDALYRDSDGTSAELVCALPRARAKTNGVSMEHPSVEAVVTERVHIVRDSDPGYASHILESNIDAGSLCVFRLGGVGFLRLYSVNRDAFSQREINQLQDVIEMFTISIEGALAQRRFLQESEERQQIEEQLRQAQKLEAVGRLTGGIAHEFNNLLIVISGSMELLKSRMTADADLAILDTVMRAMNRGAELTDRMLSYGRKQLLQPRILDMNEIISQSSALLSPLLGETIGIETKSSDNLWRCELDRGQFETALLNLAANARDAMPQGGMLMIATRNVHLDASFARRHPGAGVGDYVLVTVTDTGTGMTPDVIEHAFDPFFTTKEVGKGSGLGLSMVHGFVMQAGGHVEVASRHDHGTTVSLYLPRAGKRECIAATPRAEQQILQHGDGVNVLVVEDDPIVRDVMLQVLADQGYTAIEAENGDAGLAAFESHPGIQLVLADVVMPGELDGIQLANKIRERCPATNIILMSGYPEREVEARGLSTSRLHLLRKPFEVADLIHLLRRLPRPETEALTH